MPLFFPVTIMADATAVATVSYRAAAASGTNGTSFSFASVNIGTAGSTRRVVVGIRAFSAGSGPDSISSVTIAGVSATQVEFVTNGAGMSALYVATVTTGTTGTIDITFSATQDRCGIAVWDVKASSATKHASGNSTASPGSVALNIPANGVAIAMAGTNAATTATWANLTEDIDSTVESSNYTGASAAFATLQTGLSLTCTYGSASSQAMVAASWGP